MPLLHPLRFDPLGLSGVYQVKTVEWIFFYWIIVHIHPSAAYSWLGLEGNEAYPNSLEAGKHPLAGWQIVIINVYIP